MTLSPGYHAKKILPKHLVNGDLPNTPTRRMQNSPGLSSGKSYSPMRTESISHENYNNTLKEIHAAENDEVDE